MGWSVAWVVGALFGWLVGRSALVLFGVAWLVFVRFGLVWFGLVGLVGWLGR